MSCNGVYQCSIDASASSTITIQILQTQRRSFSSFSPSLKQLIANSDHSTLSVAAVAIPDI